MPYPELKLLALDLFASSVYCHIHTIVYATSTLPLPPLMHSSIKFCGFYLENVSQTGLILFPLAPPLTVLE